MRTWRFVACAGVALALGSTCAGCGRNAQPSHAARPQDAAPVLRAEAPDPTPTADPFAPHAVEISPGLTLKTARLSALAPDAEQFLLGREPQWGVAVVLPDREAMYEENAEEPFPMASVTKIVIMVTVMDQSIEQRRDLTSNELDELRAMITTSDNDSATALWRQVGGGQGVTAYLASAGIRGIHPVTDDNWGDSTASPAGIAQLLAKLSSGQILDAPRRELALELLSQVEPGQRWGVTVAFPGGAMRGAAAVKNGWYEGAAGWRVNSVGIDDPEPGDASFILAVMTRNQPSFEAGVATIEGVSLRVAAAVRGWQAPSTVAPPHAPVTAVVRFTPATDRLPRSAGSCSAPSDVAHRDGAWRCTVAGEEYDPCFAAGPAPTAEIVCGALPLNADSGTRLRLTTPLPAVHWQDAPKTPWFLLLEDSATCVHVKGPPLDDDGDHVSYYCSDARVVIGGVQRSATWSVRKGTPDLADAADVNVVTAWY